MELTRTEQEIQGILEDTYIQVAELTTLPIYKDADMGITQWYTNNLPTGKVPTAHNNKILSLIDLTKMSDENKRKLGSIFMDSYSRIYNLLRLLPHGNLSLVASDFMEIQNNPRVIAASAIYWKTGDYEDLQNSYKVLHHVMRNDISPNNALYKMYISGSLKKDQFEMQFAPRGSVANKDAHIYDATVKASYGIGLASIKDNAVDSRTAINAVASVNYDIGRAEGASSRARILASVKRDLIVDCGTTDGLDLIVQPPGILNGVNYKGDLAFMDGLYYYKYNGEEFEEEIHRITKADIKSAELNNQRIKLRSQLTCEAPSDSTCKKCAGYISELRVQGENFGIINSAVFVDPFNQATLSPKHRVAAAAVKQITLPEKLADAYELGVDNRAMFSNIKTFSIQSKMSPDNHPEGYYIDSLYVPGTNAKVDIDEEKDKLRLVLSNRFYKFLLDAPAERTSQRITYDISEWDLEHSIGNLPSSTVNFTIALNKFKSYFEGEFHGTLEEYWEGYKSINTVIGVNWSCIQTVVACRLSTVDGRQVQGRNSVVLPLATLNQRKLIHGLYLGNVKQTLENSKNKDNDNSILDCLLYPPVCPKT